MRSEIVFRDGRRVNLSDGVAPEMYAELESTQGCGTRKDPLLFCGGCGGGVYIKHGSTRREELFGTHFEGNCPETLAIHKNVMSDEHKRMQEYAVRAAEVGGFDADTEVPTSARTRVDVVVDRRIGIEVQLSKLTAGAAVNRTGRSISAGLETVAWVAETPSSQWIGRVPGFQWLDDWRGRALAPMPRSVRSRGLLGFRADRHWRGGWEAVPDRLTVLVDDAIVRIASGTVRPVIYAGNVELVTADALTLYEELTGVRLPPFTGTAPARTLARAPEALCRRPQAEVPPVQLPPPVTACAWCHRPFDEESMRFRLTVHPNCANERVEMRFRSGGGAALWNGDGCTPTCRTTPVSSGPRPTAVPGGC